jgi:hypothetical protein
MDVAMNDIQIENELINLVIIEAQIEWSLRTIISKKEKEQIRQTRKSLEEARISLLSLLESEKLALQNNQAT